MNKLEYLRHELLEDLGFEILTPGMKHSENYDWSFEIGYRHPRLDPFNLILVDYKNGSWHFAQRKHSYNGIGKMVWLDDLLKGFEFVTGFKLIE
jgi:hypothetical protein